MLFWAASPFSRISVRPASRREYTRPRSWAKRLGEDYLGVKMPNFGRSPTLGDAPARTSAWRDESPSGIGDRNTPELRIHPDERRLRSSQDTPRRFEFVGHIKALRPHARHSGPNRHGFARPSWKQKAHVGVAEQKGELGAFKQTQLAEKGKSSLFEEREVDGVVQHSGGIEVDPSNSLGVLEAVALPGGFGHFESSVVKLADAASRQQWATAMPGA